MIAIHNANIVLTDQMVYDGVLLADGGNITAFGRMDEINVPKDARIIDGGGHYLGPGLVDIHTHAGGDRWFYDDPEEAARVHLAHGSTSVLPALYYNLNQAEYIAAIGCVRKAASQGAGRIIRGIYLEGPYLNPGFGADADNNQWAGEIRREDYLPVIQAAAGFTRVVCVAPEREGIDGFVDDVKEWMPDVRLAVAHSQASPAQIEALVPRGLCIGTHHTNATGDRPRYPECRGVCVDEAVNYNRDIYAELICDAFGIHVDPYMLRLVRRIKGDDRLVLISDACAFDGPVPEGKYAGVMDINFDAVGQIAGSKLTLDRACLNMMRHTGAGLCDVFRFASTNPAKAVGLEGRGQIRPGAVADLVLVDHRMRIRQVFLAGTPVEDHC